MKIQKVDSREVQKRIIDATAYTLGYQEEPDVISIERLRVESPYGLQPFDVWTDGERLYVSVSDAVLQGAKFRNALATLLRAVIQQ